MVIRIQRSGTPAAQRAEGTPPEGLQIGDRRGGPAHHHVPAGMLQGWLSSASKATWEPSPPAQGRPLAGAEAHRVLIRQVIDR